MNKFSGTITSIETEGHLSLVEVKVRDILFKSIIIDSPNASEWLKQGSATNILFKETEVVLAKVLEDKISLQNRIECEITKIIRGKLLSEIKLSSNLGAFSSIITTKSVNRLELEVNQKIIAMIKTNEIMLAQ